MGGGAGRGWHGARWGNYNGGQEDQMAGDGGDGRVQEGQMVVAREEQPGARLVGKGQLEARWKQQVPDGGRALGAR